MSIRGSNAIRQKRIKKDYYIIGVFSILIFLLLCCDAGIETVENTKDQRKLCKIAMHARDKRVRLAAAKKLTDLTLLMKLAKEGADINVCIAAIKKLRDQALLAKLFEERENQHDRLAAVEELTDQELLAELATRPFVSPKIRFAIVKKLTDQALLVKVATRSRTHTPNYCHEEVRLSAVEKITNQALLAEVAMRGNESASIAAIERLTDQVVLAKVALAFMPKRVRLAAVKNLSDQALLAEIAMKGIESVSLAAVENLSDQALLAEVVTKANWDRPEVRLAANKKLTDRTFLAKLAMEGNDQRVRDAAVENLTDQTLLVKLATEDDDIQIRKTAIVALGRIGDTRAVEPLIALLEHNDSTIRVFSAQALGRIGDSRAVEPLSKKLTDRRINFFVAKSLRNLGWHPDNQTHRIHFLVALREKAKLKDPSIWPEVKRVLMQDIRSGDSQRLEFALSAFTGIGNDDALSDLLRFIRTKGTKTIAEAYLNCNHEELRKAAGTWAAKQGYHIISTPFGGETWNWGSW